MNHKIKVIQKKHVDTLSDDEIHRLMDFDGLALKASRIAYGAKILAQLKLITGGLAAVSVSVLLIWNMQDSGVPTLEKSAPSVEPTSPPAAEQIFPGDSVVPPKEAPAQRLSSKNVKPKESVQVVSQVTEAKVEPSAKPPGSSAVFHEAEPLNGFPHLYEYFQRELKYPEEAVTDSVQGVVTVAFIITSRGQVDKITVMNSLGPAFDAEAIRLISHMPAWKPATIDGIPVASRFSLPLNFQFVHSKKE